MMLPTHVLAGLAIGVLVSLVAPESAGVAIAAGVAGGLVPDLDLYAGHRRTLHYPVYYPALAVAAVAALALVPTPVTAAAAAFLLAAAAHCLADVFGGGLELRPWEGTSERAVYDHRRGRWLAPRRWVRYDGAPEDLLLSVGLAVPLLVAADGVVDLLVLGTLAVAAVYATLRRVLPAVAVRLIALLPDRTLAYVPARYTEDRAVRAGGRAGAGAGEARNVR